MLYNRFTKNPLQQDCQDREIDISPLTRLSINQFLAATYTTAVSPGEKIDTTPPSNGSSSKNAWAGSSVTAGDHICDAFSTSSFLCSIPTF
jgi:hypothetical protein